MLIGNTEVLCIAAQVGLVFLIGGFLGSFGIGEGLPLAIDLILTERYIADGKVKEVTPVGGLKAAYCSSMKYLQW